MKLPIIHISKKKEHELKRELTTLQNNFTMKNQITNSLLIRKLCDYLKPSKPSRKEKIIRVSSSIRETIGKDFSKYEEINTRATKVATVRIQKFSPIVIKKKTQKLIVIKKSGIDTKKNSKPNFGNKIA